MVWFLSTLKALKNDRDFLLLWAHAEKLAKEIKQEKICDVVAFTLKEPQQPDNEFVQDALLKKKLHVSQ